MDILEGQSLDSELGTHHRLLIWGKLISAKSGISNILKAALGSHQIHKSPVKSVVSGGHKETTAGEPLGRPPRPGGATCLLGLSPLA